MRADLLALRDRLTEQAAALRDQLAHTNKAMEETRELLRRFDEFDQRMREDQTPKRKKR